MYSVDLLGSTRSANAQFLWFLCVGGGGALGFVLLSSLAIDLHTGVADWLVSALCYAAMIAPVYLAHRRFSFRSEAPHGRAFPRYVLVQICGLSLAAAFSYVAYGLLRMPTVPAAVMVTGLTAGVNFVMLRLWAFADDLEHEQKSSRVEPSASSFRNHGRRKRWRAVPAKDSLSLSRQAHGACLQRWTRQV